MTTDEEKAAEEWAKQVTEEEWGYTLTAWSFEDYKECYEGGLVRGYLAGRADERKAGEVLIEQARREGFEAAREEEDKSVKGVATFIDNRYRTFDDYLAELAKEKA